MQGSREQEAGSRKQGARRAIIVLILALRALLVLLLALRALIVLLLAVMALRALLVRYGPTGLISQIWPVGPVILVIRPVGP